MSWSKSDSIAELTKALVKVQAELKPVKRAGTADAGKFKYAYSTLEDVCAEVMPKLSANGLAVMQFPTCANGSAGVTTILAHSSGEWVQSMLLLPIGQNTAQAVGSGISYSKRYSLCAIVGVVGDEDDDGQAAQPGIRPQVVTRGASKDSTPSVPPTSPAPASGPPSGREAAPTNGAIGHMHRRDGESLNVASVLAHARSLGWKDAEVSTRAKKLFRRGLTSLTAVELLELDDIIETGEDVQA